jgi:hypothetical protein
MYLGNYFLIERLVCITKFCNVIRRNRIGCASRDEMFYRWPTKNVTLNSRYIEDDETIPLSIGQLDDIEPVGTDDAISLL